MAGSAGPGRRLALDSLPGARRARLHLLPCAVEHDGPAPVRRFFAPALRAPKPDEPAVSFRGRSLKGKQVLLPEGYVGLVVEEDPAPFLVSEEQKVRVKSTFESLTVWNLEQAPDSSSEVIMALSWPKIAEGAFKVDLGISDGTQGLCHYLSHTYRVAESISLLRVLQQEGSSLWRCHWDIFPGLCFMPPDDYQFMLLWPRRNEVGSVAAAASTS